MIEEEYEKVYRKDGTEINPKELPITYAFALWEKHATPEELKQFSDGINAYSKSLRVSLGGPENLDL